MHLFFAIAGVAFFCVAGGVVEAGNPYTKMSKMLASQGESR